ncbi:GSCOCT00014331001.2-RA-CDS [Cotesia congregata]|uniref:Cc_single_4.4 n=2 Tax=root TaxID=1 RepID=S6D4X0_COTCN|nr:hypothetical protein CcBV_4.4 [Bracoviriform congregatae]CAD6244693.1 GSCOCT00014331001.2-RA-CDS [Cotesia congregata]CAG17406.1 hypothetical protein CcBV_4.4 [Bracoviriform congregatae]CAG5075860.1 cc_single_4.4 [Cotesia congregata]CCQ71360.1 hypothetical protein CcBV_4.4 [Cotesia congregata]
MGLIVILINFNTENRKNNSDNPGRESNPVSFGCALRALPVKLSETTSITTFQSNNFLFNTIEKHLLEYSRYNYLSILKLMHRVT